MATHVIRVPIDPTGQLPQTATDGSLSPTNNGGVLDTQITTRGLIKGAVAFGAVKSVGSTVLGTVGDLTGSGRFQRNLSIVQTLGGYGVTIGALGVGGVAVVGAQVLSEQIGEVVEARNANIDSRYQASLSGRRIGNR